KLQQFTDELKKLHEQVSARQDALPALQELKQSGYKICVLTDSYYPAIDKWRWFKAIGLSDYLDEIVSSYDIRVVKDSPKDYPDCLKVLGVSAGEAIFVGHQPYEMAGAKAAHIRSVAELPIAPESIKSDYSVGSLTELPELLEKINQVD